MVKRMDLKILTDLHVFIALVKEVCFRMRSLSLGVRAYPMQRSIGLLASVLSDGSDFIYIRYLNVYPS